MLKNIVSSQWLLENLGKKDLVIIDCRFQLKDPEWGYQEYLKNHIPGAYYLNLDQDLSSPKSQHGGRHPLPNLDSFMEKLGKLGIVYQQTQVIAYDDSRFAFAARLWWLLRFLGHGPVALLDGGWNSWLASSYPTSDLKPIPSSTEFFKGQPQLDWVVDLDTVKGKKDLDGVVLIDSRDGDRYLGKVEPIDPIAGHIPGAVNEPWKNVTDSQGYLRPLSELKEIWAKYQDNQEIMVYCGSGVTACVNLFCLELLQFKNALLYPGGWSDWCSYQT